MSDDDDLRDALTRLRDEYRAKIPSKIQMVRDAVRAARANPTPEALATAQRLAHQVRGSGGSYGYERLSEVMKGIEEAFVRGAPFDWEAMEAALEGAGGT